MYMWRVIEFQARLNYILKYILYIDVYINRQFVTVKWVYVRQLFACGTVNQVYRSFWENLDLNEVTHKAKKLGEFSQYGKLKPR